MKRRPSVKSLLIRRNADIYKTLYLITIHKVQFPSRGDVEEDSEISCCFERGGKMSSTLDTLPDLSPTDNSFRVNFKETLSLVATLYKNKATGDYQDKPAKLVVRMKKKGARRGQMYKALGVVDINLSSFATGAPCETSFVLTKSEIDGGVLQATIATKAMAGGQEDTMSMQSGFSDPPLMSADFSITSFPKYSQTTKDSEGEIRIDQKTMEQLTMELRKKTIQLENLQKDCDLLTMDFNHTRTELAETGKALEQLKTQQLQQLDATMTKSDAISPRRVHITNFLSESSLTLDKEAAFKLKDEIKGLLAEIDAQEEVHSKFTKVYRNKESQLLELKTKNLHLTDKINELTSHNIALKQLSENSISKEQYEEECQKYESRIEELSFSKTNAETEMSRLVDDNNDLLRRLQLYSENVAELEVNGATSDSKSSETASTKKATPRKSLGVNGDADEVNPITFEGYLTKRGSFYPSWKRRHFILHGDSHLSYYTNKEDMVFKGHFIISEDTVIEDSKISGINCFYLEHSKRRLYMKADSKFEELEWKDVFRRSIEAVKEKAAH